MTLDAPFIEDFLSNLFDLVTAEHDFEVVCRLYTATFAPTFNFLLLLSEALDKELVSESVLAKGKETYLKNYARLVKKPLGALTLDRMIVSERYRQPEEEVEKEGDERVGLAGVEAGFGRRKASDFLRELQQELQDTEEDEDDSDAEEIVIPPRGNGSK